MVYENGTPKYLLTEEGYVTLADKKYHYFLKDHQGNNRVVIDQSGAVEEVNHYYPFGGTFASTSVQPYKYNSKEYDGKKGLNWYDYGARHYDAATGRFTTVDPMAEKYYSLNPYSYCNNNPVLFIDPNGLDVRPYSDAELTMIRNTLPQKERDFVVLDDNGYINKSVLNSHKNGSSNYNALKELVNSDLDIYVRLDKTYKYRDNFGRILHENMSYVEPDEYLADKNFESPNGLTTGEGGKNGITLLPGNGQSGINSIHNGRIDIIINEKLSEIGRAETYSHEANGHALIYVRTKNRDASAHHFSGMKELNTTLRNMIIDSRKETIKNLMHR